MNRKELRAVLDDRGMTIEELATALDVRFDYARGWLLGEHAVPGRVDHYLSTGKVVVRVGRNLAKQPGELERYRLHVKRMCEECEPDLKACRDAECPLRGVSPLPMHGKPFGSPRIGDDFDGIPNDYGMLPQGNVPKPIWSAFDIASRPQGGGLE